MSSDPGPSNSGPAHVHAVREFFELLHKKDIEAWGELWHEEGRIIVPYPAEGFPTSIEGKAEIVTGFSNPVRQLRHLRVRTHGGVPGGGLGRRVRRVSEQRNAGRRHGVHE